MNQDLSDDQIQNFKQIINDASSIVIIQADNPDGDSLASALSLEALLSEQGKAVHMVCGIDIPQHLRYLSGWDRVVKEPPKQIDASILVDCSSEGLLETLSQSGTLNWLKGKPFIVIDHHSSSDGVSFATLTISQQAVATGEIIYELATALNWIIPVDAAEMITVSIMADSLGFSSEATTSRSLRIVADCIDRGVDIAKLDNARRELMRRDASLLHYKGELLLRTQLVDNGRIALVSIPWQEIQQYSHLYNPSMLVLEDLRMTMGVRTAIALKIYKDGKITGKIRCTHGTSIASKLAEHFGGGGHPYASGFKLTDGSSLETVIEKIITVGSKLLDEEESAKQ